MPRLWPTDTRPEYQAQITRPIQPARGAMKNFCTVSGFNLR
jgi:hypothetical protein